MRNKLIKRWEIAVITKVTNGATFLQRPETTAPGTTANLDGPTLTRHAIRRLEAPANVPVWPTMGCQPVLSVIASALLAHPLNATFYSADPLQFSPKKYKYYILYTRLCVCLPGMNTSPEKAVEPGLFQHENTISEPILLP